MTPGVVVNFTHLKFADVYRDGGSYGATLETDTGKEFSIWLQRSRMPDANGLHHRWLFAYEGREKPSDAVPVLTGSDRERDLLQALDRFMGSSREGNRSIERLREMIGYIRTREPCLPHDLRTAG